MVPEVVMKTTGEGQAFSVFLDMNPTIYKASLSGKTCPLVQQRYYCYRSHCCLIWFESQFTGGTVSNYKPDQKPMVEEVIPREELNTVV